MRVTLATAFGLLGLALAAPVSAAPPAPGLVAAYAFDEGSGDVAVDASGNGRAGAIVGAAWTGGRYGGALAFDGSSAYVGLGSLGSFAQSAFTLEAWVQKQGEKKDVAVLGSWTGSGPMIWVDHLAGRYRLTLAGGLSSYLDSGRSPAAGQWQHLAATYDGTTARFYVDGVEVASRTADNGVGSSDTWRIGAYGSTPGGFFDGVIDDVRIYDRALSPAEIQTDMSQPVSIANAGAPTEPANLTVAGRNETGLWVEWSPSSDDAGVAGYTVYRDGVAAGTTTATAFTFSGLACGTSYELAVEAFDGSGDVSPRAVVNGSTSLCDDPVGLVAAYGFDEGAGAAAADASGNGNTGSIAGATWTSGRSGTALAFDGSSASVALGALGTFYRQAFTLEAWVKKSTARGDAGIVGTWTGGAGGPMLWVDHIAGRHYLTLGSSFSGYLDSGRYPKTGTWQHLAATFDGTTARLYVDGVETASRAASGSVGSSNAWRIGAYGSTPGGFFDGVVDDVRIYDRALSAGEIRVDMNQPVRAADAPPETPPGTPPDTTPPSVAITAPAAGTVTGALTVTADAVDEQGWAAVQFKLDGKNLGAEDRRAPYTIAWDTRGEVNGPHTLTAVARDRSGNSATSDAVAVTVANTGVSPAGLVASYAFDEGAGASAGDSSGNARTAALVGAAWTSSGRFGGAVSLDGAGARLDLPALGTFYRTAFTFEAWVYKDSGKVDAGVLGSWSYGDGGGAMIWVDHLTGRYRLALGSSFAAYLDSGRTPAAGRWQHVAATYDGSIARIYVDGVEAASARFAGSVGSANAWRLGAYGAVAGGFLDGRLDNVRIYDRALSASEIEVDMASRIQPDRTPPTVTSFAPAAGATGVSVTAAPTATFSEPMQPATITTETFALQDPAGNAVPASVSYDPSARVATLTPQGTLEFATQYRAVLTAGGARDLAGNGLAADVRWSFTTEEAPPPVLVVSSTQNPFGGYLGEILRNEGLNAFTTIDVAFLSPALLARFDVVVLGQTPLSPAQVSALTGWVNGGGNLVAMRPDKQLAGLLGLSDAGGTVTNGYLRVDTATAAGAGIVGETIQFHGAADSYSLSGATPVATLYTDASTATASPAVTLRSVGTSGGEAAAFTYDLARSVVYTRQGNPAWASQNRDGLLGMAPNDLFYGAAAGDPQPDWVDTARLAIPQADEQQRLLVNLITTMARDRLPLPRFWYLPRGEKAVVAMSADDHSPSQSPGGTAFRFDRFAQLSPAGCVVSKWECVRGTSYVYPDSTLTPAQAAAYDAAGFEIALHTMIAACPQTAISQAQLASVFATQLEAFRARYGALPPPVTSRNHCYYWPDWASNPRVELTNGIRLDGNYDNYPAGWIGTRAGFLTGGGFPMRFADETGKPIDVYQQNTNITDNATTAEQTGPMIASLLDNAVGARGFYGSFGVLVHAENPQVDQSAEAIVAAAQARGVPVVSYRQLLAWVDGRDRSAFSGLAWSAGTLTFVVSVAPGAEGLQAMIPLQGPTGTLSAITSAGAPVTYTTRPVKGIAYAFFTAASGTYRATYS